MKSFATLSIDKTNTANDIASVSAWLQHWTLRERIFSYWTVVCCRQPLDDLEFQIRIPRFEQFPLDPEDFHCMAFGIFDFGVPIGMLYGKIGNVNGSGRKNGKPVNGKPRLILMPEEQNDSILFKSQWKTLWIFCATYPGSSASIMGKSQIFANTFGCWMVAPLITRSCSEFPLSFPTSSLNSTICFNKRIPVSTDKDYSIYADHWGINGH